MKHLSILIIVILALTGCDQADTLLEVNPSSDSESFSPLLKTGSATGQLLYGAIGNYLVTLDPLTGDATEIGQGVLDVTELAYHTANDVLYGIGFVAGDPHLLTIDRSTGASTIIGPINLVSPVSDVVHSEALAYNEADGQLYAAVAPSGTSRSRVLATVDPATGNATQVASISGTIESEADGMEFVNGTPYIVDIGLPANFYSVNLTTGNATFIGDLAMGNAGAGRDMAYDAANQVLYGTGLPDRLITISLTTGVGTVVGQTHGSGEFDDAGILAVAFAPPPVQTVAIDIKPGSDPNAVNCGNEREVITVAIWTTGSFNALDVDHTTVVFEGAAETHVNKKTSEARRHEEDVDGDGDLDLVLHFRQGDTSLDCSSTGGTLVGSTFGGQDITGTDSIVMVPPTAVAMQ